MEVQDTPIGTTDRRSRLLNSLKFVCVAGGGLFGDGYLNTSIGFVVPMLGYLYWKSNDNSPSPVQGDEMKGSFLVGMMIGQFTFGFLGDTFGRHRVYGKELFFTIFGTLLVVLLPWKGLSHTGIVAWIAVFRFITGCGTGGDYPITSSIAAESRLWQSRSRLIMLTFSFYTLGIFAAGVTFLVLLAAFKGAVDGNLDRLEWVWRLLLGLGIIPALFTMRARLKMSASRTFQQYAGSSNSEAHTPWQRIAVHFQGFRVFFRRKAHVKALVGAAISWFLYDIASYGIILNQSVILRDIGLSGGSTPWEKLWHIAIGNIVVQLAGSIPGVYLGVFLPDLIGRRNQQAYTCLIAGGLFAIWAGVSDSASAGGRLALFVLAQFALSCGPNITTFLIPAEIFPTRVRATAHGISAASGKVGAILTAYSFGSITNTLGLRGALGLFAGLMCLVALVTAVCLPEAKGKSLEDIEEDIIITSPDDSSADFAADSSESNAGKANIRVAEVKK